MSYLERQPMTIFMSILLAVTSLGAPTNLDLPPEGIISTAEPTELAPATRGTAVQMTETSPPPSTTPSFASDCDEMHWYRARVGLPQRFDGIGWRESNCRLEPDVRTSCCVGWWQLNVGLHLRDHRIAPRYHACGVYSYRDVDGPGDQMRHACATKALFDVVGYSAWAATA